METEREVDTDADCTQLTNKLQQVLAEQLAKPETRVPFLLLQICRQLNAIIGDVLFNELSQLSDADRKDLPAELLLRGALHLADRVKDKPIDIAVTLGNVREVLLPWLVVAIKSQQVDVEVTEEIEVHRDLSALEND